MTTYNTRDPIGSGAAKNFYDNAQNLDFWANSQTLQKYPDRFGYERLTLSGMNVKWSTQMVEQAIAFTNQLSKQKRDFTSFYNTSQSEVTNFMLASQARLDQIIASKDDFLLGDYAAGPYTLKAPNQTITHNGNTYRVKASTPLPYTLKGKTDESWVIDAAYLRVLTDADLRASLASAGGTAMIGLPYGNVSNLFGDTLYIEQFVLNTDTSWEGPIQRCLDTAIANRVPKVRGRAAAYNIKSAIYIRNAGNYGLDVYIRGLTADASWPANTSLWDATPMIVIGDDAGNQTNIDFRIGILDGGDVADGVHNQGYGYALSLLDIGYLMNCVRGVSSGDQEWPNASIQLSGKYWINNWLPVYIVNNPAPNTAGPPIVEGWKMKVLFTAANRLPGVWIDNSGQYAQIEGDFDFNGRYITLATPSSSANFDDIKAMKRLRGKVGSASAEYLTYYNHQGTTYLVFLEDRNVAADSGNTQFCKAGDVITFDNYPNTTITVGSTRRCSDNASMTNYYDILHDFERAPFAKVEIACGYLSGVIGGLQFTSDIAYHNSFEAVTRSTNGFAVGNDGNTMTFHNKAQSEAPFLNVTSELMAIQRRLQMGDNKISGVVTYQILNNDDAGRWFDILNINDTTANKYGGEGSAWHIEMLTNYQGVRGSFDVACWGVAGVDAYNKRLNESIFEWRIIETTDDSTGAVTGAVLQIRQSVQPRMEFSVLKVRKG